MRFRRTILLGMLAALGGLLSSACSPEIGSEAWCEKMREKPKGEWTGNEARDYAKHCLFDK